MHCSKPNLPPIPPPNKQTHTHTYIHTEAQTHRVTDTHTDTHRHTHTHTHTHREREREREGEKEVICKAKQCKTDHYINHRKKNRETEDYSKFKEIKWTRTLSSL